MAFLDETGLAELWSLVKGEDAKLAAADVKVATGSYVGTNNTVTLTFGFTPKAVFISAIPAEMSDLLIAPAIRGLSTVFVQNTHGYAYTYCGRSTLSWSGNSLSLTVGNEANASPSISGKTYYYIAIG